MESDPHRRGENPLQFAVDSATTTTTNHGESSLYAPNTAYFAHPSAVAEGQNYDEQSTGGVASILNANGDDAWSRMGNLMSNWPELQEQEIESRHTARAMANAEAYLDTFSFSSSVQPNPSQQQSATALHLHSSDPSHHESYMTHHTTPHCLPIPQPQLPDYSNGSNAESWQANADTVPITNWPTQPSTSLSAVSYDQARPPQQNPSYYYPQHNQQYERQYAQTTPPNYASSSYNQSYPQAAVPAGSTWNTATQVANHVLNLGQTYGSASYAQNGFNSTGQDQHLHSGSVLSSSSYAPITASTSDPDHHSVYAPPLFDPPQQHVSSMTPQFGMGAQPPSAATYNRVAATLGQHSMAPSSEALDSARYSAAAQPRWSGVSSTGESPRSGLASFASNSTPSRPPAPEDPLGYDATRVRPQHALSYSSLSPSNSSISPSGSGPSTSTSVSGSTAGGIDFAASNELLASTATRSVSKTGRSKAGESSTNGKNVENGSKSRVKSQAIPLKTSTSTNSHIEYAGETSVVVAAPTGRKGGKRLTSEILAFCIVCTKPIARLMLRGSDNDFDVPHKAEFTCVACIAAAASMSSASPESNQSPGTSVTGDTDVPSASSKTAAAAVVAAKLADPNNEATPPKINALFRKRHKRDVGGPLTSCDVCLRDIAVGAVVADDQRVDVSFQVEVICDHCHATYQRCSDCGGGGGGRVGVGKWRSKQLFVSGRKTCSLSHLRLGALSDMFYDVIPIRDIPRDEVDELSEICEKIFANTLFAGMCIPEVIEQKSSIATTYEGIVQMVTRGWQALEPLVKVDIEATQNIRRYLCLRSCAPNPRKTSKGVVAAEPTRDDRPRKILRDGKDVVGFILAEWEPLCSSLFLSVVVPWSSGETYDATTILIQNLLHRVEADRIEMNQERAKQNLPELEALARTWTMMFFKRDTRMMNHLEKKRGFKMLEEYLEEEPTAKREWFPPVRPCYLPVERQEGWAVLVRPHGGANDFSVRRTAEDVKHKKKEIKARARREQAADDDEDDEDLD